ncbi:inorganic phosphate transporter [Nocardioides bruguierae]|uniref:Inorganic phosphate transporter n=1 Tax=Nocardioides bruguierae TaxID=2945102 RepID=A0A9X2D943_9ACTN|nr:inorganic phosphate transporter [Nocardioides bruguierae]MCL8026222.1 inorganic phosphate transporter [Nocardioides bruguierae]MCM0621567.1 inorganic phosphate transporter [Nocardioides bruguierae]
MDLAIIVAVVVIALVFDYTNGFHDAANAVATSVSTRALTPRVALALAAVMNFVGALLGQAVAVTISEVVTPSGSASHGLTVVMAALLAAIAWNIGTWWRGLPSSSSHALIGGLLGAALVSGSLVHWGVVLGRVVVPLVLSPLVGFALAMLVMVALMWVFRRSAPQRTYRGFRMAQTLSAAAMALGHGLQDAQKTMGVIVLALIVGGYAQPGDLPLWVVLAAATAISLGTWAGGWRIMRTLGRRIIDLDPPRGFAAESVAASVMYVAAALHAPVSTTHTITSAVVGAGATRRLTAVRWGVARSIAIGWALTLPGSALLAALAYGVLSLVGLP